MTNSKRKGSKNERGISHLFVEWTGYDFARTPQSGGMGWHNKLSTGDIICTHETHISEFTLSIEAKFHRDLDFSHFIDGTFGKKTNKIIDFWDQCLRDADRVKKIPCLFMRRNGMKADMHFVVLPLAFHNMLKEDLELPSEYGYIELRTKTLNLTILNSIDFFNIPYKQFHKVAKRYRVKYLTKKLLKKR